jgi:hypothetical protein
MSITIDKLATRCRVPRGHEAAARVVAQVAHRRLARALAELIGPALAGQPRVVRIRRLNVRLTLGAGELSSEALADAWAQALVRSLFEALAYPTGFHQVQIVRADNRAAFLATFLRDLLGGTASGRWEYAEFAELLRLPVTEAALTLLQENPADVVRTLTALAGLPDLEQLLLRLDDLAAERLFLLIAQSSDVEFSQELTWEDVVWTARQVPAAPRFQRETVASRRLALWIFVQTGGSEVRSPRLIFQALMACTCLLACSELLEPGLVCPPDTLEAVARRGGLRLLPAVAKLFQSLDDEAEPDRAAERRLSGPLLVRLGEALEQLRPLEPTRVAETVPAQTPWLAIQSAGLLLLVRVLQRLGWSYRRGDLSWLPWREPRWFQVLLAGVGSAVLGQSVTEVDALEPAVLLFAGMERQADIAGLRHMLAEVNAAGRRRLLEQLAPDADATTCAVDWATTLDALAGRLVDEFGALVRGFWQASREALVRQFLRTPGQVRLGERVVSVLLEPSPYHAALHVSGLDDPLSAVSWMGDRRLEYRLLGL